MVLSVAAQSREVFRAKSVTCLHFIPERMTKFFQDRLRIVAGYDGYSFYFHAEGRPRVSAAWPQRHLKALQSGKEFVPVLFVKGWNEGMEVIVECSRALNIEEPPATMTTWHDSW